MGELSRGSLEASKPSEGRLDSWKEIAAFLHRDVTTAQRWEKREGMPVHRHLHDKAGSVYAYSSELDAWHKSRKQQLEEPAQDQATKEDFTRGSASPSPIKLWRKPGVVSAIAAGILLVAAVAAWRASSQSRLNETDVILLASFVNRTGDPIFDNSLDKALEVKLTESPFLSLFPEADVRRTMGTMRHDPGERVTHRNWVSKSANDKGSKLL